MTTFGGAFTFPEYDERPQRVDQCWQLRKGNKTATCELWTHPVGAEVRVEAGGEFLQSEAGRDGFALMNKANEWREAFIAKGWAA